jgi:hypothetical protein
MSRRSSGFQGWVVSIRAPRSLMFSVEAHSGADIPFCPDSLTTNSNATLFPPLSRRLRLLTGCPRLSTNVFCPSSRHLPGSRASTFRRPTRLGRQQPQANNEVTLLGSLAIDNPRSRPKETRGRLNNDGLIRWPLAGNKDTQPQRAHVLRRAGISDSLVFKARNSHGYRNRFSCLGSSSSGIHLHRQLFTGQSLPCWLDSGGGSYAPTKILL